MKNKEDILTKLDDAIKFGWRVLGTELAEIYENKINDIIELINKEE